MIRATPSPAPRTPDPTCQPSADAACGTCSDCREAQARRFDDLLRERLELVRRSAAAVAH